MSDVTRILESHLFSVLHSNLDLAARLIPKILDRVHTGYEADFRTATKPNGEEKGSEEGNSGPETQQPSEGSSSITVSRDPYFTSRSQKHDRDSGESDDEEKDSSSKKPRRDGGGDPDDDPGSMGTPRDTPNFACHFHKLNPRKYGPWTDQRYEKCTASRIKQLRRIKSVPGSTHSIARLMSC